MKKVLFIAILATASLASCKKDRTCVCTTSFESTTSGMPNTATTSESTIKDTKKKAKEACDKLDDAHTTIYGNWTTACEIK